MRVGPLSLLVVRYNGRTNVVRVNKKASVLTGNTEWWEYDLNDYLYIDGGLMKIPNYPEWEPDSHMNLWTRINAMYVKLVHHQGRTTIYTYPDPYEAQGPIVMENMTLKEVQKNLYSILAVETTL
jgi:hypothetical protein